MENTTSSSFYKEQGEKNLQSIVGDLFVAGSETSSNSLSFATLYLSQHLGTQRKAQAELDRVVGLDRQVFLSDDKTLQSHLKSFKLGMEIGKDTDVVDSEILKV
ncbi:Methyl farnesoate epoxidase [Orchesella cincta]|uniref:Methyl farnesoate epoxidase n=1 Tax=Orchesella cincta TaxID=48709 RepID=A0A1D2M6D0_ORCCI|nr:Methyl farnesoate epoxidase [Orchesella cincta]